MFYPSSHSYACPHSNTHSGNLHLGRGLLGDLADVVQHAVVSIQGDLVPWGDGLGCMDKYNIELVRQVAKVMS